MLCSSFRFGIRQSFCPPSPVPPSVLTSSSQSQIVVKAESQGNVRVTSWRPLAVTASRIFCSHMSPVFKSRSEEHTSELQSLAYLVCRLLLEKKKQYVSTSNHARHPSIYLAHLA